MFPSHIVNWLTLEEANKLLEQRDRQWQALFDNALDAIAIADDEGRYVDCNPAACALFGLSKEELLRKKVADFADPNLDMTGVWQQFLQQGQQKGEFSLHRPDGRVVETEFAAVTNFIPHRHLSVLRDITNRKRAEQALRESEAKASSLTNDVIDKSPVGIFILDADFRVVWLNQTLAKFFGLRKEDVIGQDKRQLIRQRIAQIFESPELFTKRVLDTYDNNTYIEKFECHVLPEGSREERWLEHLSQPIHSGLYVGGRIEHYTDITERKLSEQKIREQATLIDVASDAIFVRDLDNRILFWNQGAERLYGWTAEEALGQKAHELFYRKSSSQLEEGLNITVEKGSWQGELEQITKTGIEIIVASRWTLMRDESGQPRSILVVNSDITEKKQLEMQFFRAQRLESLGTLAGGIAHDLNNIFTPILGIAQLLPFQLSSSDPEIENLLEILRTSAKRGSTLVKQILSFARGGDEKECQLIQIGHLLWEVKNFVQQTFPKSIAVEAKIPKNLWTVRGDPTQLHQVLMNLCVNARDAMSDGGTLSISAANQFLDEQYVRLNLEAKVGPYLVITVSDTGTGISPEILDQIFDPFFTTKELGQGTGLGLSTVRGIIKAHDGFITVCSEVGRGSQFQVYLPAAETDQTEREAEQDLPKGQGELILLVDDEAEIREITKKTLETYNYRVLTASDGIEAIAVYAQEQDRIDAVLLDLMMPQMDGLTAMRTLHKINPNIKMIAVSGVTTKERTAAATEIGSQAFLAKPYRTEELLLTLRSVICNS